MTPSQNRIDRRVARDRRPVAPPSVAQELAAYTLHPFLEQAALVRSLAHAAIQGGRMDHARALFFEARQLVRLARTDSFPG